MRKASANLSPWENQEIAAYHEHGYIVVHKALTDDEVRSALEALDDLIAGKCEQFNEVYCEVAAREGVDLNRPEARRDVVRKLSRFLDFDERLHSLAHHSKLFDVATMLLGGRPSELFQDMALLKPPRVGREKPWHQDQAFSNVDLKDPLVGVWIALDEATVKNGCM